MYDQMYWHLTYGDIQHQDPVTLRPAMRDYTVYIDAISKVFAATGVRVGWSMGPATIISKMKAILTHIGAWAPMAEQKTVDGMTIRVIRDYSVLTDKLILRLDFLGGICAKRPEWSARVTS